MTYDKILSYWEGKHIRSDAELSEALNAYSVSSAYHSGNLENEHITFNDVREIFMIFNNPKNSPLKLTSVFFNNAAPQGAFKNF
jgi:hypothetical protein